MSLPVFVDGVPKRIEPSDFTRYHLAQFPRLANQKYALVLEDAIESAYTMFIGIGTLWKHHPDQVWFDKTRLCYRLLVAWYIADTNPTLLAGVPSMGGVPLKRKKIDSIDITYADDTSVNKADYEDLLKSLKSNPFGAKAYFMIKTAARRAAI